MGFRNVRATGIRYGDIARMAAVSAVVQQYVKLLGFDDVQAGLIVVKTAPDTLLCGALAFGWYLGAWSSAGIAHRNSDVFLT